MAPAHPPQAQPRAVRWHYPLLLLTLMSAVVFMDRQILAVLIQPVKDEFGLSDFQVGAIGGLASGLSYLVFGIPLGRVADRGPRRRLIVVCRAAGGLVSAAGAAAVGFWSLLLARCGNAVSDAGGGPASMALLSEMYPVGQRARVLSVYGTGASLGALLSVVLGAWLAQHWGWRWTLACVGLASVGLALLLRLTVTEPSVDLSVERPCAPGRGSGTDGVQAVPAPTAWWRLLEQPVVAWLLVGAACAFVAGYGFGTWNFTLLVRRHGLGLAQAGLVSGGAALAAVLGGLASGVLADRCGDVRQPGRSTLWVPVLGLLLAAPCGLVYLWLPPQALAWACALIWAYAFFVVWWVAPLYAALAQVVAPGQRATANALVLMTGAVLGNGLGPVVTGWLSDRLTQVLALTAPGEGLRLALVAVVLTLLPAALAFALAARVPRHGPAQG